MAKKRGKSQVRRDRRIERYEDTSMGLPVVLIDSAIESSFDGERCVGVPDVKGLEAAIAVARVTIPDKLNAQEIKFLRKALGLKAIELASFLDVVPETLSRWENGRETISTNPERIFRMRVLRALKGKAPGVCARVDDLLDMKLSPIRSSLGPILLIFRRMVVVFGEEECRQAWVYEGVEERNVIELDAQNVA